MWLNNGKRVWEKDSTLACDGAGQSRFATEAAERQTEAVPKENHLAAGERATSRQAAAERWQERVQDIEFMQIEMEVIEGLKVGNDCLRSMHEIMSIEDVERILDETQESIDYQRQIDEMLAGALTQDDEDAVLAELQAITQGEDIALPEVPAEPIPEVPEAAKAEPERREAKNKLEREMQAA
ncbi:charged multivesicular body protein 6 isoform X2 [Hippoglossus stenolepis]|uniref:charged multivesicular body protein 6 isoform X2 n=1 Tax=Hippoglossus stenolepis TaxID=195615 RepID=UPI00159CA66E|nr:charged multivesicular body protein 6 isoform X2 [Hippoglossus stenolepis]